MISYDTLEQARRKAGYIKDKGLGGAMWWESSGDAQGERSIIGAVSISFSFFFFFFFVFFTISPVPGRALFFNLRKEMVLMMDDDVFA